MAVERISLAIEAELLQRLDEWVEARGHGNRSEAVRDLIRARFSDEAVLEEHTPALGSLTLIYDHSRRELSDHLVEAGHRHHGLVISSMHVHLDETMCLELLALRGRAGRLRALAEHMGGMKGVHHYQLALTAASTLPGTKHD